MRRVTGGGFDGNVHRILPKGVRARVDPIAWPRPAVFDWIQKHGDLSEDEMLRVFNCGIGMVLVVKSEDTTEITDRLRAQGERAYVIGCIEAKESEEAPLSFAPLPQHD